MNTTIIRSRIADVDAMLRTEAGASIRALKSGSFTVRAVDRQRLDLAVGALVLAGLRVERQWTTKSDFAARVGPTRRTRIK